MKFAAATLVALVATTAQAGFIKKLFSRDEIESMFLQVRDATEAEWYGKIQNWNKPEPIGMSETVKAILKQGGCNPPTGAKAKRSLESEVSEQHLLLVRNSNPVIKKADAWEAAKNPGALSPAVKKAFKTAGWSGSCVTGIQARSLGNGAEDFDLYAREFDDEFYFEQ